MSYYTYLLKLNDGTYYCGYTNDLKKGLKAHNEKKGAKYTRSRLPAELVYFETFEEKSDAMKREAAIKKLKRSEKQELIDGFTFSEENSAENI